MPVPGRSTPPRAMERHHVLRKELISGAVWSVEKDKYDVEARENRPVMYATIKTLGTQTLGRKKNNTCSSSSSQSLFSLDCNARRPDLQQRQQQHALIRNKQYLPEGGFILVNTFMHMKIWYIIVRAENIPP